MRPTLSAAYLVAALSLSVCLAGCTAGRAVAAAGKSEQLVRLLVFRPTQLLIPSSGGNLARLVPVESDTWVSADRAAWNTHGTGTYILVDQAGNKGFIRTADLADVATAATSGRFSTFPLLKPLHLNGGSILPAGTRVAILSVADQDGSTFVTVAGPGGSYGTVDMSRISVDNGSYYGPEVVLAARNGTDSALDNSWAKARAAEYRLLPTVPGATRIGPLLSIRIGAVQLVHLDSSLPDGSALNLVGDHEGKDVVIHVQDYESERYGVYDTTTGNHIDIPQIPVFSPDGSLFLTLGQDPPSPVVLAVYSLSPDNLYGRVFERQLFQLDPGYVVAKTEWQSHDRIRLTVEKISHAVVGNVYLVQDKGVWRLSDPSSLLDRITITQ